MDLLTFIAELVKALAWPICTLAVVFILRKPLAGLIPLLQRVKYKDVELEFAQGVKEVKADAALELPPAPVTKALTTGVSAVLVDLTDVSPRAAVMEAWRQVVVELLEAAKRKNLDVAPHGGAIPQQVLHNLKANGYVDKGKVGMFDALRMLRNQAAHAPEFALDKQAVLEYVDVATRMAEYFKTL